MLTLLMTYTLCGGPMLAKVRAQATGAGGEATPKARAAEALAEAERLFEVIRLADQAMGSDRFDPQAVIEQAGREPQKLLEWVRENTRQVPYQGRLRGPVGVLLDRRGNSLDRALLLAELLVQTGHGVRLAQGELPPDVATKLQSAEDARGIPSRVEPDPVISQAMFAERVRAAGFNPDDDLATIQKIEADRKKIAQAVDERCNLLLPVMQAALASAPADAQSPTVVTDHWWVQVSTGDGNWQDLEPLQTDASAGPLTTAAQTVPYVANAPLPAEIPSHEVVIRIIADRLINGSMEQATAVEATLVPADLHGRNITLVHRALNNPATLDGLKGKDPVGSFKKTLLAQTEWLPTIEVGRNPVFKGSIRKDGSINEEPVLDPAAAVGQGVGNAMGGFGAALGGGGGEAEAPESTGIFAAEWIEYEVRPVGAEPYKLRRQLFDLVGPAARAAESQTALTLTDDMAINRAATLAAKVGIAVTTSELTGEFLSHLSAQQVLANRQFLTAPLRAAVEGKTGDLLASAKEQGPIEPGPGPLQALAVARHSWNSNRSGTYHDRPNIMAQYRTITINRDNSIDRRETIDIVENHQAVLSGTDVRQARLKQGVIDTVAEAFLLDAQGNTRNASTGLAQVMQSNQSPLVLKSAQDPALAELQVTPDMRARISADLAGGNIVVAGRGDAANNGWWRINPTTGQTLGMGPTGYGASTAEYGKLTADVAMDLLSGIFCFMQGWNCPGCSPGKAWAIMMGCFIATGIGGIGSTMGVVEGGMAPWIMAYMGKILNCLVGGIQAVG